MYYQTEYNSPLGKLILVSDEENLVGLWMEGQKYYMEKLDGAPIQVEKPILTKTKKWLDDYFLQKQPAIKDLKLSPIGTPFQQIVWEILCEIPYGETMTYGEIAKKIATIYSYPTMSAQAVGGAVGHNHISIIIPCHRVIGADGKLTGYAGGLDKKIKLLKLEMVDVNKIKYKI